ncbi:DNA polymerase III subunit tau [bacterium HR15]|nr:DNA polymerase III subunit tau [bacterium HR15]
MAYLSLYRKYRAQDFDELMGQSHITTTLRNAIQQGRWAHAYLFCGPRGTGKTSTARLLAKALNCEQGPTPNPCKQCRFCRAIQEGNCVDVIEMDAASETSIEDVRTTIIENAKYPPMEARFKVYIIDEVHDLSAKAFDALLKTLEEPPPHVIFILATTEFHRVPPTIRSRCQRFDFHRGTIADIAERLRYVVQAEGLKAEPAALHLIARAADGSWRDALTALEQVIAFSAGVITPETVYHALGTVEDETLMRLTDALITGDAATVLTLIDEQLLLGREPRVLAESLIQHWRALTQAMLYGEDRQHAYDPALWGAMREQAMRATLPRLLHWWERMAEALMEMRAAGSPRAVLELTMLTFAAENRSPLQPSTQTERAESALSPPKLAGEAPAEPKLEGEAPAEPKLEGEAPAEPKLAGEADEEANQRWRAFVEKLKEKSPVGGRNLEGSRVHIEGDTVRLYLRSEMARAYFRDSAQRERTLAEMVRKQLNMPQAKVILEVMPHSEPPAAPPPPVAQPILEGEALVEAIKRTFNGHEITPDEADESDE